MHAILSDSGLGAVRWLRTVPITITGMILATSSASGRAAEAPPVPAGGAAAPGAAAAPAASPKVDLGRQLYTRHCAACHGEQGDGKGLAALFLYPKPRDLRAGRFRLVSTANNVPTREDLHAVLLRGMPGSSMPPWGHLSQTERDALVDEVLRLWHVGVRDLYVRILKEDEELTDEEIASEEVQQDIAQYVAQVTTPGPSSVVPDIGAANPAEAEVAKLAYAKFGCLQCHGPQGKGDGVQKMIDSEGFATAPRDFTAGIFKGGHDPASLYRRIAYGMPGTPMPSAQQMTPEQMVALVHYIRGMSTEAQREAAILNRATIVARAVAALPAAPDAAEWSAAPEAALRMTPLWWRDNADPQLRVQALHDGKTLALRLRWLDASRDSRAVRPDEFEDLAAVELTAAGQEPFLGMGAPDTIVDVWQWRAGLAASGAEDHLMDEYPFDTPVYQRLAAGKPLPDFITARVAGNPLAVRRLEGSNLAAKGPGTTTFRPPVSQLVSSRGGWTEGRWTVVLTRPLGVPEGGGLPLAPGGRYAAAFAIWNGSAHDRAGQKLITIWNDLKLE